MLVCRNCKYFRPDNTYSDHDTRVSRGLCTFITSENMNIVSGKKTYQRAETMRKPQINDHEDFDNARCGPEADYYVAAHPYERIVREIKPPPVYSYAVAFLFGICYFLHVHTKN